MRGLYAVDPTATVLLPRRLADAGYTTGLAATNGTVVLVEPEVPVPGGAHVSRYRVLEVEDGHVVQILRREGGNVSMVAAAGGRFVMFGRDVVAVMEGTYPYRIVEVAEIDFEVAGWFFDGLSLALTTPNGRVIVLDVPGFTDQWTSPLQEVRPASVLALGDRVLAGTHDGHILAWNRTINVTEHIDLPGHVGAVRALATDERFVYTGGDDGFVVIRDRDTLERVSVLMGHNSPVRDIVPMGDRFVSVDASSFHVWERPLVVRDAASATNGSVQPTPTLTPSPSPTENPSVTPRPSTSPTFLPTSTPTPSLQPMHDAGIVTGRPYWQEPWVVVLLGGLVIASSLLLEDEERPRKRGKRPVRRV